MRQSRKQRDSGDLTGEQQAIVALADMHAKLAPTRAERRSLELILELAKACACTCDVESDEEPYIHAAECWVYSARDHIKRIEGFLDRTKVTT